MMVEATGLEPAASWSQTKHSTKLSYASLISFYIIPLILHFVKRFFAIRQYSALFSVKINIFIQFVKLLHKLRADTLRP